MHKFCVVAVAAVALTVPDASASTTAWDLISPTTCTLSGTRLNRCVIPPGTLLGDPVQTAVPLRTVFRRQMAGTCSTPYPLEVSLTPAGQAPVRYPFLQQPDLVLRAPGGQPLTSVALVDSSSYTPIAAFATSCRISLNVKWNEPDVNSRAEAESLLADIRAELAESIRLRDRAEQLLLFSEAFELMQALADNFRVQLSNESMQELRASALEVAPALEQLIVSCSDLSEEDRYSLIRLYGVLPALGHPEDWTRPDGSTKTLADFLDANAQTVFETLEELGARADGNLKAQYEQEYTQAAQRVEQLNVKLALATAQLQPWLQ